MDVNVPYALTEELRSRGVSVLTAQEDGAGQLPDPALLDRASALGRLLFTHDVGFLREAALRQERDQQFLGVVFARQGKVSLGECVRDLEIIAQASQPEEWFTRVEYLPLK